MGLRVLAAIALISLAIGITNALRPRQSQDVKTVAEWSELWLWNSNPYAFANADYPPNALVSLAPLALVPESMLAVIWVGLSLVMAGVAVWLTIRQLFPWTPVYGAAVPAVLFFSWGGLRIGLGVGQFQLLALALGLAAVAASNRRPGLSGLLLGLAFLKPHLAAAFFLWAVLTGRVRVMVVAVLVVLAGVLAFSVRLGQSPVEVTGAYLSVLSSELGGPRMAAGIDLRPVVHLVLGPTLEAGLAHLVLIAALFSLVVAVSMRGNHRPGHQRDGMLLSACCAFGVLALPHGTYDIVLLLPAAVWLYSPWIAPASGLHPEGDSTGRRIMFGLMQAALVLEIPGLAYRFDRRSEFALTPALSAVDTAVAALAFGYVVWTALVATSPQEEGRSMLVIPRSREITESP